MSLIKPKCSEDSGLQNPLKSLQDHHRHCTWKNCINVYKPRYQLPMRDGPSLLALREDNVAARLLLPKTILEARAPLCAGKGHVNQPNHQFLVLLAI